VTVSPTLASVLTALEALVAVKRWNTDVFRWSDREASMSHEGRTEFASLEAALKDGANLDLAVFGWPVVGDVCYPKMEADRVAGWLWWRASHDGARGALLDFERFAFGRQVACLLKVLVSGFHVPGIGVTPAGMTIVPVAALTSDVQGRDLYERILWPHRDDCIRPTPASCLWQIRRELPVAFFNSQADQRAYAIRLGRTYSAEVEPLVALTGVIPGKSAAQLIAFQIDTGVSIPTDGAFANVFHSPLPEPVAPAPENEWSQNDLGLLAGAIQRLNSLDASCRRRVQISLVRLASAMTSADPLRLSIDLRIALEALFINLREEKITKKLSRRMAAYIGDPPEYQQIFDHIHELYGVLSDVVHSGFVEVTPEWQRLVQIGSLYLSTALLRALDEGKLPDWPMLTQPSHIAGLQPTPKQLTVQSSPAVPSR
jgi:hypothetical protein